MMISYTDTTDDVTPERLQGFFSHWLHPPSPERLLDILQGSDHVVLAVDAQMQYVIGYITAITDGVSCAYIPHLEVRQDQRGLGIGTELVRRMLDNLQGLYMIDLMCDAQLRPFYRRFGFQDGGGMILRNYARQACV